MEQKQMLNIMVKNQNKKEVIKMDMYQKRKIRAEKKNNDSQKSFSKVSISCLITIYRNSFEKAHK